MKHFLNSEKSLNLIVPITTRFFNSNLSEDEAGIFK